MRSSYKYKLLGGLRRFAIFLLVVWTVVSLVTLLIELVPGDPAVSVLGEQATPEQFEQFRQKHGLDRPPFFFFLSREIRAVNVISSGMALRIDTLNTGSHYFMATWVALFARIDQSLS